MTDNNNNTEGSTIASAKWPQDAPHDSEEHVISVLCGEQQYRWAIHEGVNDDFFPILSWRCVNYKALCFECVRSTV